MRWIGMPARANQMFSNPWKQNDSQSGPERIGNEVGDAGVSGRKERLQAFDGETNCESECNRDRHRAPRLLQR